MPGTWHMAQLSRLCDWLQIQQMKYPVWLRQTAAETSECRSVLKRLIARNSFSSAKESELQSLCNIIHVK
jgi:hypothetical protein